MSTEIFCLANLPVDCLEPIVRLLSAYDIGHLWLTGNFRLLYLLSEGSGVREFHFSHEPTYPLLWPRLMALFPHLTSVSLEVNVHRRFQKSFASDMSTLPRQIQFLNCKFVGDFSSFKKSFEDDPSRYAHLKLLHLLGEVGDTAVDLDLSSLEALTSFRTNSKTEHHRRLGKLVLPPGLTHLSTTLDFKDLPTLPTTLTDLSLRLTNATSIWHQLPRGLLHLRVKYLSKTISPSDFNDLPPNLITFDVRVASLKPDMISKLPTTLRHLKIKAFQMPAYSLLEKIFPLLPKNLETIGGSLVPFGIAPNLAKLLPVGLRNEFRSVGIGSLEHLPSTVESLAVTVDFEYLARFSHLHTLLVSDMNLKHLKILPRTLKGLHMYPQKIDLLNAHVLDLPRGLTTLAVSPAGIEKEAWQSLPRGLTSLRTSRWHGEIEPHLAALQLPPTLVTLSMIPLKVSQMFLENLPTTLTDLEISVEAENMSWCESLSRFKLLRQLHIGALGQVFSNARRVLQNIPRRLIEFNLCSDKNDLCDVDLVQLLPPGLVHLNLTYSSNITLSLDSDDEDEEENDGEENEEDEPIDDQVGSMDAADIGGLPPFLSIFYTGN